MVIMEYICDNNERVLTASFRRLLKAKIPFSISESFILPCITDATKEVIGGVERIKMNSTSLPRQVEAVSLEVLRRVT